MNAALREAINAALAITTCAVIAVVFYHWPAIYHWLFGKRSKEPEDPTEDIWGEGRPGNWRK